MDLIKNPGRSTHMLFMCPPCWRRLGPACSMSLKITYIELIMVAILRQMARTKWSYISAITRPKHAYQGCFKSFKATWLIIASCILFVLLLAYKSIWLWTLGHIYKTSLIKNFRKCTDLKHIYSNSLSNAVFFTRLLQILYWLLIPTVEGASWQLSEISLIPGSLLCRE